MVGSRYRGPVGLVHVGCIVGCARGLIRRHERRLGPWRNDNEAGRQRRSCLSAAQVVERWSTGTPLGQRARRRRVVLEACHSMIVCRWQSCQGLYYFDEGPCFSERDVIGNRPSTSVENMPGTIEEVLGELSEGNRRRQGISRWELGTQGAIKLDDRSTRNDRRPPHLQRQTRVDVSCYKTIASMISS